MDESQAARAREKARQAQRATPTLLQDASAQLDLESSSFVDQARGIQSEQSARANSDESPVQRYDAAILEKLSDKQLQVERLEDKLEQILNRQAAQLQTTRGRQPGWLALPSSRARWLNQSHQQEATLQRIQSRLQMVRDLRDGVGISGGPRMLELARHRLAHEQPGLVAERDAAVQAELRSQVERRLAAEHARRALDASEKKSATLTLRHQQGR